MSSMDFMIPVNRAHPKNGVKVLARIGKHVTFLEYDNGFPMDGVQSWLWLSTVSCTCHKLRWNLNSKKSGRCKKCGTFWKKE